MNLSLHRSQGLGGGGLLCLLKTGRGLTPISIKEGQGIGRAGLEGIPLFEGMGVRWLPSNNSYKDYTFGIPTYLEGLFQIRWCPTII